MLKCCELHQKNLRRSRFSTLQRVEIAEILCSAPNPVEEFCFSTLQRVEIAEIFVVALVRRWQLGFSTLQRVEIAEMWTNRCPPSELVCFSTLQRVEIAEIRRFRGCSATAEGRVSVLFNESKLLK